ncbi:5-oxoprolinase subunit B family protein [Methylobacterium nodulans]|uniref:Allophanate hydrolase subunit 1 n=1 Tax=Methylobacterium nodulans (strain LMG 21967 / CNCM I-2342 / ORS 2060) TaxID=460265 RepID=B8IJ96_METNO|nr:allophanate hydrolase subunit 1 [Methylobacterium nodulans]ACL56111.1 Allophanate hydrolase subunit 1 [Methylobacterium nodulans ORS 2060]
MTGPRLLDAGEAALVAEFGDRVDPAISDLVLALDDALRADPLAGLRETVPTYRSLMIHYDPLVLDRETLAARVRALADRAGEPGPGEARHAGARWILPCCYDPALAEDIGAVAEAIGRPVAEVARLHAGAEYRVYMYGFAPGFAYLGGLPEALAVSRRATPRPPHPPNALMIGGGLAAVGSVPMPTGWYVIGRTPERLYAPDRENPFPVSVGDTLRFEPVDAATFADLDARAAAGERVGRREAA